MFGVHIVDSEPYSIRLHPTLIHIHFVKSYINFLCPNFSYNKFYAKNKPLDWREIKMKVTACQLHLLLLLN